MLNTILAYKICSYNIKSRFYLNLLVNNNVYICISEILFDFFLSFQLLSTKSKVKKLKDRKKSRGSFYIKLTITQSPGRYMVSLGWSRELLIL